MCIFYFIAGPFEAIRIRFRHVIHEWRYELLVSISLSSANGALKIENIMMLTESVTVQ